MSTIKPNFCKSKDSVSVHKLLLGPTEQVWLGTLTKEILNRKFLFYAVDVFVLSIHQPVLQKAINFPPWQNCLNYECKSCTGILKTNFS